jgi:ubiquinone/menaquinone biosynthesis C-methylase UbiE
VSIVIASILIAAALLVTVHVLAVSAGKKWLRRRLKSYGKLRSELYEYLYSLEWSGVTTNNYGFAPAELEGSERFQLQMYRELYKQLHANGKRQLHDFLEVSCGRGGGLVHLLQILPNHPRAVGLDYSESALRFCRQAYGQVPNLTFVRGAALQLPFANESFDVVLNVEASNDYGDYRGFFCEISRVLRPGGAFLYSDSRRPRNVELVKRAMREAGLEGKFLDITSNVANACRFDSDRRRQLIRSGVPWRYRIFFGRHIANYAAIEGSRKFEAFCSSRRLYFLTCAIKTSP